LEYLHEEKGVVHRYDLYMSWPLQPITNL
jgi:hypothetical protein